jgi:hypothetical protein
VAAPFEVAAGWELRGSEAQTAREGTKADLVREATGTVLGLPQVILTGFLPEVHREH